MTKIKLGICSLANNDIEMIAGAMAGVAFASSLTFFFAKKFLESLEVAILKIENIDKKVSEISVRLNIREEDSKMLQIHDKKIALIEDYIQRQNKRSNYGKPHEVV